MNAYWKSHFEANAERFGDSPLKQVDRTLNGQEEEALQVDLSVQAIAQNLAVAHDDGILDIGCGNGLVTRRIAPHCRQMLGIDFSEKLILEARRISAADNIAYMVSDMSALRLEALQGFNKAFMQDAIQCIDDVSLLDTLRALQQIHDFQMLFVAGVPDLAKLETYYDTPEKLAYHRQRLAAGKPHIGTWWGKDTLAELAAGLGFAASFVDQDPRILTSHYRYDCLLQMT